MNIVTVMHVKGGDNDHYGTDLPGVTLVKIERTGAEVRALIEIRTCEMGEDRVFLVMGGTAHIGASATAYRASDGRVHADVIALPGHRERELALELASLASSTLGRTVSVLVGIHLDKPTKQQIADVVEEARRKMRDRIIQMHMLQD